MAEWVVTIEIDGGDSEDMAVRTTADTMADANDRAWAWAEKEGLNVTGAWAFTLAEIEDSWGPQEGLPIA